MHKNGRIRGLVFDGDVSDYQFDRGDLGHETNPDVQSLADAADNVIAETKEAVESGEFENWDDSKIVNSYEYAHTNSSEVLAEGVRAMRNERTRENLRENWPEFYDELTAFVSLS